MLSVVALVAAAVALWLAVQVRGQVAELRSAPAAVPTPVAAPEADQPLRAQVDGLRRELDQTIQELNELKAAAQVVPAPPLPKARRGGLDELREQLRASHREADADEDAPENQP